MALLREPSPSRPSTSVKNLIAVLWDAQLYAEFCQASRELLAQIGVSLDSPERAADPNFHFVERRARFDVADSAQRHRCPGVTEDDAFRWFEAALQAYPEDARLWIGSGVAAHAKGLWTSPRRDRKGLYPGGEDTTLAGDQRHAIASKLE